MKTALLLAPEPPYPLRGGGAMRTAALLNYLAAGHAVDAVLFRQDGDPDPRQAIPSGLVRETLVLDLPFHFRNPVARAWRNLWRAMRRIPPLTDRFAGFDAAIAAFAGDRRYSLAVVEHSWCAPYLDTLRKFSDSVILDMHNVESMLHTRCAYDEPWPISKFHRRFAIAADRFESTWLPRFDKVLAASDFDRRLIVQIAPECHAFIYPNTLPYREQPTAEVRRQIVFSANFAYPPNRTGAAWFATKVWPILRARHPDLVWVLAGKNDKAVRRWTAGDPSIVCTGEIEDTFPVIAASMVAVVPLLSGSGTRLKILEAWAAGVPVVSTSQGAEGLPAEDEDEILTAEKPEEFASAVSSLIESPERRAKLGAAGRQFFVDLFTWETGWKLLERQGI